MLRETECNYLTPSVHLCSLLDFQFILFKQTLFDIILIEIYNLRFNTYTCM